MGLFDKFSQKGNSIDLSNAHIAKVLEMKQEIEANANKLKPIVAQSQGNAKKILEQAYIDLKYANPLVNEQIKQIDEEISKTLDDLKLLYARRVRSELTIANKINNLLELIQQRQALE